jgi:hypothetical protein
MLSVSQYGALIVRTVAARDTISQNISEYGLAVETNVLVYGVVN